jgi:hypothetical protein
VSAPDTVRVMATDPASQGPFVVINAADFDPAVHELFEAPAEPETAPARKPRATKPNT